MEDVLIHQNTFLKLNLDAQKYLRKTKEKIKKILFIKKFFSKTRSWNNKQKNEFVS